MTIQQLSIFIENRQGRLAEVLEALRKAEINIVALSLADTSDFGMLRVIVSDPKKGQKILKELGFSAMLTDVMCIRVPHAVGSLSGAMGSLVHNGVNVEYMYAFANGEDASAVLKVDDASKGTQLLQDSGYGVWKAEEVYKAYS